MPRETTRWIKGVFVCLMDCAFLCAAYAFAMLLYTYFTRAPQGFTEIWQRAVPWLCVTTAGVFGAFRIYLDMWGHITMLELIRLAIASGLTAFLGYLILRAVTDRWVSPIIGVTGFYLFATLTVGTRVLPSLLMTARKYFIWKTWGTDERNPLLIVGAGDAADALIKDMQSRGAKSHYRIVGLVDDDPRKIGHVMRGVPVLGAAADIPIYVERFSVKDIIIAIPSATTAQRRNLISICSTTDCRVRTMPSIAATEGHLFDDIRPEQLLDRQPVHFDRAGVAEFLAGKTVMVTGAAGSIGSELCRQIMRFNPRRLVIFDIYENNAYDLRQELRVRHPGRKDDISVRVGSVQDMRRLEEVFAEVQPYVVFHASAYKHVPLMEQCPRLAIENNVFGTYNTALCAIGQGVKRFVMISTDKAVNPTNVMGASKRLAELVIQSLNGQETEFVAVRFGNVLGSNGSVVPVFRRQIEAGGPVTITHPDIIRYFMTIPEAARLVLQAGARAQGGETFILDMGDPVKIVDLAHAMIRMAGLTPDEDIEIEYTGLRPGEKLYEELLLGKEGEEKTEDEKIYVAHSKIISNAERENMLGTLHAAIDQNADIKGVLRKILPTYRPTV